MSSELDNEIDMPEGGRTPFEVLPPRPQLTLSEKRELVDQEQIIEDGLQGFMAVGQALAFIRDNHLWKSDYDTFEEYIVERWSMSKSYAYRIMRGSKAANGLEGLNTEFQARELTKVPTAEIPDVWGRARMAAQLENREVTASDIRRAASEPSIVSARPDLMGETPYDADNLSGLWKECASTCTDLKDLIRRLVMHAEGCWLQPHMDDIIIKANDILKILLHAKPAGTCPSCKGLRPTCDKCRGRGWLPRKRLDLVAKMLDEEAPF